MRIRIQDPGSWMENPDPGSGIKVPDPEHWRKAVAYFCSDPVSHGSASVCWIRLRGYRCQAKFAYQLNSWRVNVNNQSKSAWKWFIFLFTAKIRLWAGPSTQTHRLQSDLHSPHLRRYPTAQSGWLEPRSSWHGPRSSWHGPCSSWHGPRSSRHGPRSSWHGPRSSWHGPRSSWHGPRSSWHGPRSGWHGPPFQQPRWLCPKGVSSKVGLNIPVHHMAPVLNVMLHCLLAFWRLPVAFVLRSSTSITWFVWLSRMQCCGSGIRSFSDSGIRDIKNSGSGTRVS